MLQKSSPNACGRADHTLGGRMIKSLLGSGLEECDPVSRSHKGTLTVPLGPDALQAGPTTGGGGSRCPSPSPTPPPPHPCNLQLAPHPRCEGPPSATPPWGGLKSRKPGGHPLSAIHATDLLSTYGTLSSGLDAGVTPGNSTDLVPQTKTIRSNGSDYRLDRGFLSKAEFPEHPSPFHTHVKYRNQDGFAQGRGGHEFCSL